MSLEKCLQDLHDEDTPLTYSSLIELSDLAYEEVPLFAAVWRDVTTARRARVIERLVEMAEDNAQLDFTDVLKIALADEDPQVQEKAIAGVWEGEDRTIIPLLLNILHSEGPPQVRAASATALGRFAWLAQEDKILPKDAEMVQESLMRFLQDEQDSLEVRRRALEAVSHFNTPKVHEYIRWAYGSSEQKLKCSSLYAMGKTQETGWLPAIISELRSASAALRYEAVCACGELGEEDVVHHLIPLLEDDDAQVQMAAVGAVGNIGGPLAKRALQRCVRTGDEIIKEAAQDALEEMEG